MFEYNRGHWIQMGYQYSALVSCAGSVSMHRIDAAILDLDIIQREQEGFRFLFGFRLYWFGFLRLHEIRKIV